jgi:hypothetical protein
MKAQPAKIKIDAEAIRDEFTSFLNRRDEIIEDHIPVLPNHLQALRLKKISDVEAKKVSWLWQPLIAYGTFTLISGEGRHWKDLYNLKYC